MQAFLTAAAFRVALRVCSLPRLQEYIERRKSSPLHSASGSFGFTREQDICWAAAVAARHTPGAACLVEALTAHYLLCRAGYGSRLRIGVRQQGDGIAAHAWVELESNSVGLRGNDLGVSYTVLPL